MVWLGMPGVDWAVCSLVQRVVIGGNYLTPQANERGIHNAVHVRGSRKKEGGVMAVGVDYYYH